MRARADEEEGEYYLIFIYPSGGKPRHRPTYSFTVGEGEVTADVPRFPHVVRAISCGSTHDSLIGSWLTSSCECMPGGFPRKVKDKRLYNLSQSWLISYHIIKCVATIGDLKQGKHLMQTTYHERWPASPSDRVKSPSDD